MGLLGNYSVLHKSPGRFLSGTIASGDRYNFNKSGSLRNRFLGDQGLGIVKFSAIPNGYVHKYSWSMAQISGGLASYKALNANISTTDALLALGINIEANLDANISTTDAILALIVALQADLSASGTITDANMAIIILLEAALSASGTITAAELQNIVNMAASLSASGTLTNSITNLVNLSADIGGAPELSPDGLAAALLNALLADYNEPGTVGEALNNVGASANPWSALLASNTTDGTFGKRLQELLTENNFIGLK